MPTKHMGNLLVSLKAVAALEDYYGAENTTLIADSAYRDIIQCSTLKCDVVYFPRLKGRGRHWWQTAAATIGFLRRIRNHKAELAISVEGDKVSQRVIPLSGAGRSLGPDVAGARFRDIVSLDHDQDHRFYDYLAIVKRITGHSLSPGYPVLRAPVDIIRNLEDILREKGVDFRQPYVILHPGATKDYKRWPPAYFSRLWSWLNAEGYQVLVTGAGEKDAATIATLRELTGPELVSMHNELSIAELVALCQNATCYIGNDTGPTHLAAATGIPTLALFGPTDEKRWGPLGPNVTILRSTVPCPDACSRKQCVADYRCMTTLAPDTVKENLKMDKSNTLRIIHRSEGEDRAHRPSLPARVHGVPPTVMHIFKRYNGNYPLLNAMISTTPGKYRTVICYLSGRDDGHNGAAALGAKTIYLELDKHKISWRKWGTIAMVSDLIDREHADILVCQLRRTIPIGALAARLSTARPIVAGVLHGIVRGRNTLGEKLVNWAIDPLIQAWVSVSEEGIEDIRQHNLALRRDKIHAIQNGIEYQRFNVARDSVRRENLIPGALDKERIYLTVGRLYDKKNHRRAIIAFAKLVDQHPDCRLVIVGKGPEEMALRAISEEIGVGDRVSFLGYRADIPELMACADVFLMPSLREGLPLALLEAMASGLPVITSDINGIREVIADIDCGWLVDPSDTSAIAEAMIESGDAAPETLQEMGSRARLRATRDFTKEKMVEKYEALYETLLRRQSIA